MWAEITEVLYIPREPYRISKAAKTVPICVDNFPVFFFKQIENMSAFPICFRKKQESFQHKWEQFWLLWISYRGSLGI